MLCSPLNYHIYPRIGVVAQPDYACGHIRENNEHFLLDCHLSSNKLIQMITELNRSDFEPLLNNIVYGNAMYSEETSQKNISGNPGVYYV